MKRALCLCLIGSALSHVAVAAEPLPPISPLKTRPEASLSPLSLRPSDLSRIERRATWKRNVGIGLAVPGVTLIVLGSVLIGLGVHEVNGTNGRLVTGASEIAGGSVSAGVGLLFTIPGALLWVSGQDDMDLAAWRRKRLAIDAAPSPTR